jgi:hypothetical protein
MRICARDAAPPADVVARAGLPDGERVLAATSARDGRWLLATRRRLVVVPPDGPVETVGWEQVEAADWSRDEDRLRVSQVGEYGERRPVHEFVLDEPGKFLALLRERVTASVVLQRRVVVRGKQGLFVVARRVPDTGEITWAYELDAGVDPDDPEVRRLAELGLQAAAEELGLG